MNENIGFFDTLVIRTPSFSLDKLPEGNDFFDKLSTEKEFLEALFIANQDVYHLTIDLIKGRLTDPQKVVRLKETVINYYVRMCTNSTPFGYFAKISALKWGYQENNRLISGKYNHHVRLDMTALDKLIVFLRQNQFISRHIKLYLNNTIYKVNNQFRYIETVQNNNKSEFIISAVDDSVILSQIFNFIEDGRSIQEIIDFLKNTDYNEYPEQDLNDFLLEMINSQLLDSELQLNLTGEDPFLRIFNIVNALYVEDDNPIISFLNNIKHTLDSINGNNLTIIECVDRLDQLFKVNNIIIDRKALVQVDLYTKDENNFLNPSIQSDLTKALNALSYFEQPIYKPKLDEFKKQFISRYEDKAMPLLEVLDAEIGIGFGKFKYQSNNLLFDESIILKSPLSNSVSAIHSHPAKQMLSSKIIAAVKNHEYSIMLSENDLENLEETEYNFGDTFQIMFSILDSTEGLLELHTAGHTSAGSLLGRFGSGNEQINKLLMEISQVEETCHENSLLAEIIHIPEARIANLSFRPQMRSFEIPILNRSTVEADKQILLEDIYIVIIQNRIVLLSKNHRSEVIPRLTTAHNYNRNSNPIYQFLSELQYQDIVPSVNLKLDYLDFIGKFIPRVQFGKVILSKAKWNFRQEDLLPLFVPTIDHEKLSDFLKNWKLTTYVHYLKNGKEIFLDWTSDPLLAVFVKHIMSVKIIVLLEFPFIKQDAISFSETGEPMISEFIAAAKNVTPAKKSINRSVIKLLFEENKPADKFFPGDNWVYYKVYCGVNVGDKFLAEELSNELNELYRLKLIDRFFFIRFTDPEYHLRLRFRCLNNRKASELMRRFNDLFELSLQRKFIWDIKIDTYTRELTRYGNNNIDQVELIFEKSSFFWLNYLKISNSEMDYYLPVIFACSLDALLNGFNLNVEEKLSTLSNLKLAYEAEFGVSANKELQKLLNKKEKDFRKLFEDCLTFNFSAISAYINSEDLKFLLNRLQKDISASYEGFSNDYQSIILSIIHMHAIRCFKTKPRENELFSYIILQSFYKKQSFVFNIVVNS